MPDISLVLTLLEKGGLVALLVLNMVIIWRFGLAGVRQVLAGDWVPGRYYKEVCADRDRIRADFERIRTENDAFRTIAFRAIGVVERVAGQGS
jgi:hypothetical protein